MQAFAFWPDLEALEDAGGLTLRDLTTGLEHRVNGTASPDANGVPPFASRTLALPGVMRPVASAVDFERRFVRKGGLAPLLLGSADVVPKGSSNDWHDDTRAAWTTGGARRRLASVGFARWLRGLADGQASLRSFARDQEPRPVGHALGVGWKYNGYFGLPPDGWKYEQQDAAGWSVFNPAHLECTALFAGAAAGDQVGAAHLLALAVYVFQTFPGGGKAGLQKGWRGSDQERAVGELVGFATRCALVGLGSGPACTAFRDRFLGGLDPKQHLVGYLKDLVARPPPFGAGNVDVDALANIGTFKGRAELESSYGWQDGLLHYWVEYALASGLVNDPLRTQTRAWLDARRAVYVARAVDRARGVAFAFTRYDDFGPAELAAAQAADKRDPAKGFVYELVDAGRGDGTGALRLAPRLADSEVTAAALSRSPGCLELAGALAALQADPEKPDAYKLLATYLEPVLAALGQ